jgi:hypothetical protein
MSEIHGAVGSYVVNALDPAELDEFEAHLAVCPTCSREVVEFCETAAELSLLATISAPPPELRSSVLSAISGVRVLPPILPPLSDTADGTEDDIPPRRAVPSSPAQPSVSAPIDELALRRARRRTRVLSLAVAAAMVVALSLGGWAFSLNRAQQQQIASASAETQLFAAPDVKIYPVPLSSGGQASFVVSKQLDKALFVGKDLPDVGSQTFELWTVAAQSDPAPAGLVKGGGDRKQWFNGPIASSAALAVSLEKAGGATAGPTNILADPTPIS